MADNKADALKEAKNKYQLKVYYEGEYDEGLGLQLMGPIVEYGEILDKTKTPWLIKWVDPQGICRQFADTVAIYKSVSRDFAAILDAVIVNAKQRQALDKIVDKMLGNYLLEDMAHEHDGILDPCEC